MASVAVLLPVFNAGQTLRACLDSLLVQTLDDLRIIAIDDGSTDDTADILAQACRQDPRLEVLTQRPNQGICAALNRGLMVAEAPLIARMDADDWSYPERFLRQAAFLRDHPDIGVVGCQVDYGGDRRTQQGYAAYVDWTNSLLSATDIALNRFVESPFAHPSVMFRATVAAAHGGYRHGPFPEDYELWLRWLAAGVRMAKVAEHLLRWSDPPRRLSRLDDRYAPEAFYRCKAAYLAHWLSQHNPHHPDVVVWGAGKQSRKRADMLLGEGIHITHYIDINPLKIGQTIHGRPVWSAASLPPPDDCFIVSYVGNRGARDTIRGCLSRQGYVEGVHAIMAA